jgi:hypothetical protein
LRFIPTEDSDHKIIAVSPEKKLKIVKITSFADIIPMVYLRPAKQLRRIIPCQL